MIDEANDLGMSVTKPKKVVNCRLEEVELKLRSELSNNRYELAMVLVPPEDQVTYGIIKYVGDIEFEVPTQVVLRNNVNDKFTTIHNIILKMNSKLVGTNQKLSLGNEFVKPIFQRPVSSLNFSPKMTF